MSKMQTKHETLHITMQDLNGNDKLFSGGNPYLGTFSVLNKFNGNFILVLLCENGRNSTTTTNTSHITQQIIHIIISLSSIQISL